MPVGQREKSLRARPFRRATLTCVDGQQLEVTGRVLSLIPLRNRKNGKTTRISEGMTEWSCEGRTGYGLSEYLDQVP